MERSLGVVLIGIVVACGADSAANDGTADGTASTTTSSGSSGAATTSSGAVDSTGPAMDMGQEPVLDVGSPPPPSCEADNELDNVEACTDTAPPLSFTPDVQWSWDPQGTTIRTLPLVANLNDDNGDASIDLCDIPDVVVVAQVPGGTFLHSFRGTDGQVNWVGDTAVAINTSAAIGDITGDGVPEIVAGVRTEVGEDNLVSLAAFDNEGALLWMGTSTTNEIVEDSAIALADLDNDGDVEIMGQGQVLDHQGNELWLVPFPEAMGTASATAVTAADLDDDGDLEVLVGHAAYEHDGTEIWNNYPTIVQGFPQVANLDDDARPEILVTNRNGISILEHDGTIVAQDLRPTGDLPTGTNWVRPAAVHDFDGDGLPEFALSSGNNYATYDRTGGLRWMAPVADASGIASGTAFDFMGDGTADAMYADEVSLFVFNDSGTVLLTVPRNSTTFMEYPVVADVDNDGSAEIVVVSETPPAPALQVIRDLQDRWIQARRIWNQHTYHVTNVREDGTIPQSEPPHWSLLNTFRTNAQIEGGSVCAPAG